MGRVNGVFLASIAGLLLGVTARRAEAEPLHDSVSGQAVESVLLDDKPAAWGALGRPQAPSLHRVTFRARGEAVLVPHCNGRERVLVDGKARPTPARGPAVLPLEDGEHAVTIEVKVSSYEKRIACSHSPRVGAPMKSSDGLSRIEFASPDSARGGGQAVLFVPGGHDFTRPSPLLVGTHPWNGSPWTYAAYHELLEEAGKRDVLLLMPSGLGNSLYVADAEAEVLRAIDALGRIAAIDPQRISIWGASMGGAGATTIAFHHPDRFAFVASYFGDSRYDLTTYVRGVLGGEAGAHAVNALDVLENGRHLPVLLVHGEDDRTCPIVQSTMLDDAMKKAGFEVRLIREPGMGHEGPLVVRHIREVVERAARAVAPRRPARVSFRSVREGDTSAYGVRLVRGGGGDALVDLERREGGVHVLAATGLSEVVLAKDALGASGPEPILGAPNGVKVRWE